MFILKEKKISNGRPSVLEHYNIRWDLTKKGGRLLQKFHSLSYYCSHNLHSCKNDLTADATEYHSALVLIDHIF